MNFESVYRHEIEIKQFHERLSPKNRLNSDQGLSFGQSLKNFRSRRTWKPMSAMILFMGLKR